MLFILEDSTWTPFPAHENLIGQYESTARGKNELDTAHVQCGKVSIKPDSKNLPRKVQKVNY